MKVKTPVLDVPSDGGLSEREFNAPLMGWSSWNTYAVNISEKIICAQADAMVSSGLREAGYEYINVDDGYFGYRDSTGLMHAHPERFPRGMKVVADYIHSKGLKAGIYSDAGTNTCGSMWNDDIRGVGSGLWGHEKMDLDLYLKDWGYDFIKLDYCGGQELGLSEEARYRSIHESILATGRTDVSVNVCRWAFPGTWASEVARSWRMSPDINASWRSVKSIIERNLYLSAYAGQGHYNDMDMLEIGRGLTPNEEQVHFAIWCMMASPLLIGCDLTAIPSESLSLLKNPELIALDQDRLGLQAQVVWKEGDCLVLAKDVKVRRGLTRAVCLLNLSDESQTIRLDGRMIELGGALHLRNLVLRQDMETVQEKADFQVPAHSVLALTVMGEKRLVPESYEAETAYLPLFNDLGENPRLPFYRKSPDASNGALISQVGGSPQNKAVFRDVYQDHEGDFLLTLLLSAKTRRDLSIDVNGERQAVLKDVLTDGEDDFRRFSVKVHLKEGMNVLEMGNDYYWAPDMDAFLVQPIVAE